ncbi:unnamed protein product, partial [Rotaria sp. Silwood1]
DDDDTDYPPDPTSDLSLPRRCVAKMTTISKDPSSNIINRNPLVHSRTHIATDDGTFDELNHFVSPSR